MIDFNPFDDLIVNEPRRPEPAVSGVNEKPLQTLTAIFDRLTAGELPRTHRRIEQAQLVTSAEPGFGKSHLIGRLFRSLHGRATLIYVRPFQNAALGFQSLLATVVKELHFPERMDWQAWKPEEPAQLDSLAFGVLAHLVADLLEKQGDDPASARRLRDDPVKAFGEGVETDAWSRWMRGTFDQNLPGYEQALARRGIALQSPEWLRVLFTYAFSYPDRAVRLACLDWISGQSLSKEQGDLIGLRAAELMDPEAPAEQLNSTARSRLLDLCQLASFHRPFVFCFDQTEAYGHSAALARSFGMVIGRLVDEAENHLTLIASNQVPWTQTISADFENADLQRIAHPPIALEGLTRAQAEQLIRLRLEHSGTAGLLEPMFDEKWLGSLFPTASNRLGARGFLQRCKERWEELRQRPVPPPPTLAELYEARRVHLLADPKRLLFDADALQWLVKDCARALPDTKIYGSQTGYFTVGCETPAQRILFGFELGSNWSRWRAIARQAGERAGQNPPLKVLMFRGAEQPPIPGPNWQVAPIIDEAKASYLDIFVLSRDDFATLYAGYDLHAEALGGDIPPYSAQDVVEFLRDALAPWWKRITGPIDLQQPKPEEEPQDEGNLASEVRTIVSSQKFLSLEEVISKLKSPATREAVLKACGYSGEIRIHSHPNMTVLQWQSL